MASEYSKSTGAKNENIAVKNLGLDPAVGFNFMLRVEGVFDVPCRAVRAFTRENEFEYIQEGGLNDYVHMRRKPISKPFTFQVERYVGIDGVLFDPLALGTDLVLPLILLVNRYHWHASYPYPTRTYTFTGCTVISKEYGELNAERSGLLVETTTIAYREMVNVDVGIDENSMEPWSFAEDGNYKGVGNRSAKIREAEHIDERKKQARKWIYPDDKVEIEDRNEGTKSAETLESTKSDKRKWLMPGGKEIKAGGVTYGPSAKTESSSKAKDRKWLIPGSKEEKQESVIYRTSANTEKASKAEERKWDFEDGMRADRSAVLNANEVRKTMAEKSIRKWPPTRSAIDIAEFLDNKS